MTTSSSGSVETSANSRPGSFSFANASFTDILGNSAGGGGGGGEKSGYKAMTPPSLPLSPLMSPSSYFNMPAGMNLADFLDSPVLLSSSIFPSPTTGAFGSQQFNWRPEAPAASSAEQGVKVEQRQQPYSDFSFQTAAPANNEEAAQATTATTFQPPAPQGEETYRGQQQPWGYQQQPGAMDAGANAASFSAPAVQATSSEMAPSGGVYRQTHSQRRSSDDGYNWRKYGQKQVKGSENPRSYYKCTFPNCPTKKKVETSIEGQITEIVYKGTHNHAKPLSTRRGSGGGGAAAQVLQSGGGGDASEHSFGAMSGAPVSTPENSSASFGDDEIGASSPRAGNVGGDDLDDDEPDSKKWRKDGDGEGSNSMAGNRTVREPRVVVQTMSDIDILDDGYRWRKYGQKVVKGNPNPRSYYKCTTVGCPVRKHVERASHDLRAVITTYEGKHNHDVPAARGSAALYRPAPRAAADSAMSTSQQYTLIKSSNSANPSRIRCLPTAAMASAKNAAAPAAASSSSSSSYSSSATDAEILRSLHRLARDLATAEPPAPFLRAVFASVSRRAKLLVAVFDDLLGVAGGLPRSASLCLREVLLVLQRFKAVVADCAARSRMRLLLQSDEVAARVRELQHDLATLLDILPVAELGLADDVADLLALASRQCRRRAPEAAAERELKASVLALIHEVEREIVPGRERLEAILEEVAINDPASCSEEIEILEREIGERLAERWTSAMIALVGLLRYAKCVLFSAATPRPLDSKVDLDDDAAEPPAPPPDFRCPISLDLMRDPVVSSSGQTYDRESITRWFGAGKSTCPKTGQVLTNLELVPNKALKNLIARWCRENGIPMEGSEPGKPEPAPPVAANKAAVEAARMTASFLVKKLSASFSPGSDNRVVHEIRQLAKSGSDSRAFIGEAGAVPLLVPLLSSEDAALQLNAVTALLNLSILEANKKRIMHAEGAVAALCQVMGSGATWRAKENAAATVLSLSAVHSYRRRLGRNPRVIEKVVQLVRTGPSSTKKDALAALLCLSAERENVGKLVVAGAAEAAFSSISEEETATAVLASLAKRGGADAIVKIDGAVARLVAEMRRGTEWSRECAAATLVLLCRRAGAAAVTQVLAVAGVEWAIWELMGSGSERARRKAASLGRACRRWAAANAAQDTDCPSSTVSPRAVVAQ